MFTKISTIVSVFCLIQGNSALPCGCGELPLPPTFEFGLPPCPPCESALLPLPPYLPVPPPPAPLPVTCGESASGRAPLVLPPYIPATLPESWSGVFPAPLLAVGAQPSLLPGPAPLPVSSYFPALPFLPPAISPSAYKNLGCGCL